MIVHLIDGTYELFRHFYGQRRFNEGQDSKYGAAIGVLNTVLQMIEGGATHVGVATDHVIESFRNDLWPGYKTGAGIDAALWAQFRSAGGRARGDGRRAVADGRARGGRRARVGGAHRRAGRVGREGVDLDARQGSRAVRARRPGGAGRPSLAKNSRRSRRARKVRRRAAFDPRLSRARRRHAPTAIRVFPASAP